MRQRVTYELHLRINMILSKCKTWLLAIVLVTQPYLHVYRTVSATAEQAADADGHDLKPLFHVKIIFKEFHT